MTATPQPPPVADAEQPAAPLRFGAIKPYYIDPRSGITIIHADARDVVAEISGGGMTKLDCFVTDPVYGVSGDGGSVKQGGAAKYDGDFDDTPEYVRQVCVPVVANLIQLGMSGALTPGTRCLMHYPQLADIGCFYHPAATGCGPWGFMSCTAILFYGKRHNDDGGPTSTGRTVTETAERFGHPCTKPIKAWTWLVNKVAGRSRSVLDPFMGSGTTLRACKDLGLLAVGVDISEAYCEIAAKRLSQEVLAL